MKEYLPVGSIIRAKEGDRYLMIIGIMLSKDDTDEIYDYTATLYPMGYNPEGEMYMLNESDIEEVYHEGYKTPNHENYIDELKALLHIDEYKEYEYVNEEVEEFFRKESKEENKAIIDNSFIEL